MKMCNCAFSLCVMLQVRSTSVNTEMIGLGLGNNLIFSLELELFLQWPLLAHSEEGSSGRLVRRPTLQWRTL